MEVEPIDEYIQRKIKEDFEAALAALPWWCMLCGEGGNYEGERPDEYWFPPKDHVCIEKPVNRLEGLKTVGW